MKEDKVLIFTTIIQNYTISIFGLRAPTNLEDLDNTFEVSIP